MPEALRPIAIDAGMRRALLGLPSPNLPCLPLAKEFENGPGPQADARLHAFGVPRKQAALAYTEALTWAAEMFRAAN